MGIRKALAVLLSGTLLLHASAEALAQTARAGVPPVAGAPLPLPSVGPGSAPGLALSGGLPALAPLDGPVGLRRGDAEGRTTAEGLAPELQAPDPRKAPRAVPSGPLLRARLRASVPLWFSHRIRSVSASPLLAEPRRAASAGALRTAGQDLQDRLEGRGSPARAVPGGGAPTLALPEPGPGLRSVGLRAVPPAELRGQGSAGGAPVSGEARAYRDSALTVRRAYAAATLRSLWWHGTTRVLQYYRLFKREAEGGPEPAVASTRRLLADLRTFAVTGDFSPLGFAPVPTAEAEAEALKLYDRHVKAPPEARASFAALISRAKAVPRYQRVEKFRKLLRDALLDAALRPASSLAARWDAKLTDGVLEDFRAFREGGEMARRRAAFEDAVREAMAAEPPGPGRPAAVILLGSYANGIATPESDFDVEVVTRRGDPRRLERFDRRLRRLWAARGETSPLEIHSYVLPVSGALLSRIHREGYVVLNPDADVAVELRSRGPGAARRTAFAPLLRAAYWALSYGTMLVEDLRGGERLPGQNAVSMEAFELHAHGIRGPPAPEPPPRGLFAGMVASRSFSIAAYILTLIALPMLAIPAVGTAGFAELMALGGLAHVAFNPLVGRLTDRLTFKQMGILNTLLRGGVFALPALMLSTGAVGWATLLPLVLLNSFQVVSTMNLEATIVAHYWGHSDEGIKTRNAVLQLNYLALQVVLNSFLGIGMAADLWGLRNAYLAAAGLVVLTNLLIVPWTFPSIRPSSVPAPSARAEGRSSLPAAAAGLASAWLKRNWTSLALLAAALAAYPFIGTLIPAVAATVLWIHRTPAFKALWANKTLRWTSAFVGLAGFLFFPVQTLLVPKAAALLAPGAVGLLQSRLLGALFFGQLLASSVLLPAGFGRFRLAGREWELRSVLRWSAVALSGLWSWLHLFPGSLPLAAAVVAAVAALSALLGRFTPRAWLQFFGAGLAFVWLPFLFMGQAPLMASLSMIGLFYSPVWVFLMSQFGAELNRSEPERKGQLLGVQGALFNAAMALAFVVVGWGLELFEPALPGGFAVMGVLGLAASALFFAAPRFIPGVPRRRLSREGFHHEDPANDKERKGSEGPGPERPSS